jgi:hypothetical protein
LNDCGDYHGWIVAIPLDAPEAATAYSPPGKASGIWGPSGIAADDANLFLATGNSHDANGSWAGGDAVMRFELGGAMPATPADVYSPVYWRSLDAYDVDLGGSGVVLIDSPSSTPSSLALSFGKDGFGYLLDRGNLGGVEGEALSVTQVISPYLALLTAPAVFTTPEGTFVAIDGQSQGQGISCPPGQSGDLVVVKIGSTVRPSLETVWCAANSGHGIPIVTTTDGSSEPIVWITADSGQSLRGYDGTTGKVIFNGGTETDRVTGLHRLTTLIAVGDRIAVAADDRLHVFAPAP